LLLLWLGGAWLAVSIIVGLQVLTVPRTGMGLGQSSLLILGWAIVSIALALALRRTPAKRILIIAGGTWALIGVAGLIWLIRAHA
jgi:hypothetical protein